MSRPHLRYIKPFQRPASNAGEQQATRSELEFDAPEIIQQRNHQPIAVETAATATLAERKFELSRVREQLESEIAQVDAALKARLSEGDVIHTRHGVGYRLCKASLDVYDQRAIRELSRMKLLPRFARISTTRLRELVTEGRLSERKFNVLHSLATPREIVTLREVPVAQASAS